LKVTGAIFTGVLLGRIPNVIEEKTIDELNSLHFRLVIFDLGPIASGGFQIHIYAQHETTFEVRSFDTNVVLQQPRFKRLSTACRSSRASSSVFVSGTTGRIPVTTTGTGHESVKEINRLVRVKAWNSADFDKRMGIRSVRDGDSGSGA